MINAILFDLDGTLADTAPDLGHALNAQLILHRRQPLALESIRPHASKGARGLLKLGFDLDPENAEFQAMREEYLKLYETHFTRNAELFPGVTELLDGLDALHVRWAIVTNKPSRFTLPLAEILGLSARATAIVCGDSCAQPKPHPEPLLLACRRMGVAPQAGLYVGDDRRDQEAARAAGMPMLVATYGYLGAEEDWRSWNAQGAIDSPQDLLSRLDSKADSYAFATPEMRAGQR
jgi:N-acetyl-D-muramate 6-phosphate phosphatase